MPEISVKLEDHEAKALLPQRGEHLTPEQWNRRVESAEAAQKKIREALRESATTAAAPVQEGIGI